MSDHSFPPRPTGRVREIIVLGALFAMQDGHPVLLNVGDSDDLYLPLFSEACKLRHLLLVRLAIPYDNIKCIKDQEEFLASVPEEYGGKKVHIIYNPYYADGDRVRFHEIKRPAT